MVEIFRSVNKPRARSSRICIGKIQDLLNARPFTMPTPSRMVTS